MHDRPPGRTAENWSRNDRIRAGSVSGPGAACRASATRRQARPSPSEIRDTPRPRRVPRRRRRRAGYAAFAGPLIRGAGRRAPSARPRAASSGSAGRGQSRPPRWRPGSPSGCSSPPDCVGLAFLFQPESLTPEPVPSPSPTRRGAGPWRAQRCEIARPPSRSRAATAAAGEAAAAPAPEPADARGGHERPASDRDGLRRRRARRGRRGARRRRASPTCRSRRCPSRSRPRGSATIGPRTGGGGGPRGLHRPGARPCGTRWRCATTASFSRTPKPGRLDLCDSAGCDLREAGADREGGAAPPRSPSPAGSRRRRSAGPPSRVRAMRRR